MAEKKKAKADHEEVSEVDNELVSAIEKLQDVQDELEKVNEEASDKVLEVEQKYNEIRRPVYNKRNEIIRSIPDFWLTAFLSHPVLCDLLSEEDQKVFKHLQSLDVEDFKDVKSGYCITFSFKPNPYFEDTKLVKVFRFSDEGTTSISGTKIRWKDGMDLTNGAAVEKEGNKRPLIEESFFKWFNDSQQKETTEGIQDEVADVIKEDLWPNPLKYFNNDGDSDEYEDEEEDDEDGTGAKRVADGFEEEEEEPDDDDDEE
ncbi:NAP1-related protein 2 isoform X2 [Selaginella moellendorffii]|uniref:NAP1-related protein 2 n=1 Tax=Selaginella moellendorffii TaxID=88036 RepID=UPI000D1C37A4|nr:NAP1-related protein 2 [Selaginella moellendorffii]XP_024529184.1 NAP1-related protein 2 isoform X2 [Selaginella moellendorffii]|eukprot:XP_002970334.2 NAP1-related protein 2 [Selaginella moellendorffii]